MGADEMFNKNGLEKNCERKPNALEFTSIGASIIGGVGWLTTFTSTSHFGTAAARALRRPPRPYGRYKRKRTLQVAEKMRTTSSSFRESGISCCCGQGQGLILAQGKKQPKLELGGEEKLHLSVGIVCQDKSIYVRSRDNRSDRCRVLDNRKVGVGECC